MSMLRPLCPIFLLLAVAWCCPPQTRLQIGNQVKVCISEKSCRDNQLVIYVSTCVQSCPYGTFYSADSSTCFNECPSDTITKGDRCINGTFCINHHNKVLFNGSCHDSCPETLPFIKYGTCYATCPKDTVVNGSACLSPENCVDTGGFIYNNTCVESCPEDTNKVFNGRCSSSCPENRVLGSNNTCLWRSECVYTYHGFIFNNTCLPRCPTETKVDSSGQCYLRCPGKTIANGVHCITENTCIFKAMVIHGKKCVSSCPQDAPYLFHHRCYTKCPKGTVLYNRSCISPSKCVGVMRLYKVIFNGTCINSCPAVAQFLHNGVCVNMCPSGYVVQDRQCVGADSCITRKMVIFNRTCILECPNEAPYITKDTVCVNICPPGSVVSNRQCIDDNSCRHKEMVIFNNTCISKCPDQYPYITNGVCSLTCASGSVVSEKHCIERSDCINSSKFVYDNTCVYTCPLEKPYILNNTCYDKCPIDTVLLTTESRCIQISDCRSQGNYILNFTCVKTCPPNLPYHHHSVCCSRCPVNTHVFSENLCVSLSECNHITDAVVYNSTCLPSCPSHVPYKKERHCCVKCPSGTVSKNFSCISRHDCTSSGSVVFGDLCLLTCPDIAPFRDSDNCYTGCPGDKLGFSGSECIDRYECKEKEMVAYKGDCIQTCSHGVLSFDHTECIAFRELHLIVTFCVLALMVFTILLIPCIYNPKKSRQMNGPKKWKQETDEDTNVLDLDFNEAPDEQRIRSPAYCSSPNASADESIVSRANCVTSNTDGFELSNVVVHRNDGGGNDDDDDDDDVPLLSGEGHDDFDNDAVLFGYGI